MNLNPIFNQLYEHNDAPVINITELPPDTNIFKAMVAQFPDYTSKNLASYIFFLGKENDINYVQHELIRISITKKQSTAIHELAITYNQMYGPEHLTTTDIAPKICSLLENDLCAIDNKFYRSYANYRDGKHKDTSWHVVRVWSQDMAVRNPIKWLSNWFYYFIRDSFSFNKNFYFGGFTNPLEKSKPSYIKYWIGLGFSIYQPDSESGWTCFRYLSKALCFSFMFQQATLNRFQISDYAL
jgi:hypothetical protein